MPKSDLSNVKEVVHAYSAESANERLKEGWILIDTAPGKTEDGSAQILYSFAKVEVK